MISLVRRNMSLLLCMAAMFLFSACGSKMSEDEVKDYVSGFTSRYFGGEKSSIQVVFNDDVLKNKDEKELAQFIEFSPSLDGTIVKKDDYTIAFVPDLNSVKFGTTYKCTIKMEKLFNNDKMPDFSFDVETIAPSAKLKINSVRVDLVNSDAVIVSGVLSFTMEVDANRIKPSMFSIDGEAQSDVLIEQMSSPNMFRYEVKNVKKGTESKKCKLQFDGTSLNIENKPTEEFDLPVKSLFEPISVSCTGVKEKTVSVYFSEKLDSKQNLNGLIEVYSNETKESVKIEQYEDHVNLIFTSRVKTNKGEVVVRPGVKSSNGKKITSEYKFPISYSQGIPSLSILDNGSILANAADVKVRFRASNIFAVDVDVLKIYSNNVLSYLRDGTSNNSYYDYDYEDEYYGGGSDASIRRYGRMIYHKTVRLDDTDDFDSEESHLYTVDLSGLFDDDPTAIYQVYLSYKKEYAMCNAGGNSRAIQLNTTEGVSESMEDLFDRDGYFDLQSVMGYSYWGSDDPTKDDYYTWNKCVKSNLYRLSDLGITVKRAGGKAIWVSVADLLKATPVSGANVTAYNYQLQPIAQGKTDSEGFCDMNCDNTPYFVEVERDGLKSYVKVSNGSELSYSNFDVSGVDKQRGLKAYIYGERNVWRPGDTLHLSLMLEDTDKNLPENCPVTAEMFNPQGQFYSKHVTRNGENGLYAFSIPTKDEDQTGVWHVVFEVGGRSFTEYVRIATIKPNRIKINLDAKGDRITTGKSSDIKICANWLTGTPATGLDYKVDADITVDRNPFPAYKNYIFVNPFSEFRKASVRIGDGVLDANGCDEVSGVSGSDDDDEYSGPKTFASLFADSENAPSFLHATVTARVFEKGGDASIVSKDFKCSPFKKYVGIDLKDRNFETDQDLKFNVVVVDENGKKANTRLKYRIFKLEWRWWSEYNGKYLRDFVSGKHNKPIAEGTMNTNGGVASVPFRINYPEWGRFLIIVSDEEGDHATGGTILIDWPSSRGMSNKEDATASTMLMLSTDKETYNVGDDAVVYIPAAKDARVLLSIESGNKVLSREWVSATDQVSKHTIKITKEMTPNVYISASLINPHAVSADGKPLRKYGVKSLSVEDPKSHLVPTIDMPDELRPQTKFKIKVGEKNGRAMSYTLAVVDEGLLDITSFKTPNPWPSMNEKEALNVNTYDMYADVVGASTSVFQNILKIGGDVSINKSAQKEKRFKPVVKFIGPFTLKAGEKKEHELQLPMYVGSVRTMVVACDGDKSYGSAEKTTTVSAPLMVMSSLPRVLTNGENVKLPVNVFSSVKQGQNATVTVTVDGPLSIVGQNTKTVNFTVAGDKMVYFDLKCDPTKEGMAHVKIKASGAMQTSEDIAIEVRNPQPIIVNSETQVVEAQSSFAWTPFVKNSTNNARVTISPMPNIDVQAAFLKMIHYPYCCSEQVSSRLLFYLNAEKFVNPDMRQALQNEVNHYLTVLYGRQKSNGAFVYWPGDNDINVWITNMAGHVLVEARSKGYTVPDDVYDRWLDYQKTRAREDRNSTTQAYRLYTLALAKKADEAAMNKMKEKLSSQNVASKILLASAYSLIGKKNIATSILNEVTDENIETYRYHWSHEWTFGSKLRDRALWLESLVISGNTKQAFDVAKYIAAKYNAQSSCTYETAYSMLAMNRLSNVISSTANSSVIQKGQTVKTVASSVQKDDSGKASQNTPTVDLDPNAGECVVKNNNSSTTYATLCLSRKPSPTEMLSAQSNGLDVSVVYEDESGKEISISNLKQGAEITARIVVKNASGTEESRLMALSYAWPSGFEPWNDIASDNDGCDYVDQRDDKKIWHFVLSKYNVKTFKMKLRAAYCGDFTVPSTLCEDMYDSSVNAHSASQKIKISE